MKLSYELKVYEEVIRRGGEVILNKPAFPRIWDIKRIVCKPFLGEPFSGYSHDADENHSYWNNFVASVEKCSGESSYKTVWIVWPESLIGTLVAYDSNNEPIKLKHFEDYEKNWKKLYSAIKEVDYLTIKDVSL